jgi:nucleoside diphosphate kinase
MSAEQLSYVLVTPYSIRKSRTGGILSRLISRTGLDLVRARMFAPSKELAEAYAAMAVTEPDNARHRATQERIRDYILKNFAPNAKGQRRRTLLLVFRGPNAVAKVMEAVGHIVNERTSGETIRDTYGDYVADTDGNVVYFEPAVLTAPDVPSAEKALKLWAKHSDNDGGLLDKIITYPADAKVEQTLVLIKPDNFRFPNARPGGVLDVFSRSGLSIIGFKVHCMSVAEAEDFYGPVLAFLQEKFKEPAGKRSRLAIERELGFALDESMEKKLGEMVGPEFGRDNWEAIVEFMSGRRPSQTPKEERHLPGDRKIVAIIYQGIDAVKKIRDVLGPTDPSKAPSGTIRKEFGNSIMVNAAHASDSPESAAREMPIVGIQKNNLRPLIEEAYGSLE